jgi:hypothetical protein
MPVRVRLSPSAPKTLNLLFLQRVFCFSGPKPINSICYTKPLPIHTEGIDQMKTITKSPSHLICNPYSYCFRMAVPAKLQILVGKKELRYSLKEGYLGVAKNKARFVAGQVQLIFNSLRN